jgi:hypothetical protein
MCLRPLLSLLVVSRRGGLPMTHETEPGIEPFDELPNAIDVETLSFEEFLERFPDDRPDDEELVRRAMEGRRG